MTFAQWLVFSTMTCLCGRRYSLEKEHPYKCCLRVFFVLIHLCFAGLIAVEIMKPFGSYCTRERMYPWVNVASDSLFLSVYVLNLVLRRCDYFRVWQFHPTTTDSFTEEQRKVNDILNFEKSLLK